MKLSIKTRRILIFFLLIGLLAIAGTVQLPQSVRGPCVVEPLAVWYIMRDGADQIATGWERNLTGLVGECTLIQFERPDHVEVKLSPHLREGSWVTAGDTIVSLLSYESTMQLREFETMLDGAIAEHRALLAGERIEDQEVAHQNVRLAEAALQADNTEYDRVKELFEAGHASLSEWQVAQGLHHLLEVELELASAGYQSMLAGARPEDVSVAYAEINRLQQLIDNTRNSLDRLHAITSPMDGIVRFVDSNGVFIRIERTDTMAVMVSIPQSVAGLLRKGQPIEISLFAEQAVCQQSTIERIEYDSNLARAFAIAFLSNNDGKLRTGMLGSSRLPLGRLTLWEGIKVKLRGIRL
ncbi:hypothetical protein HQ587_11225 [bacterium]|nr:hypothetical protein [bacterium]